MIGMQWRKFGGKFDHVQRNGALAVVSPPRSWLHHLVALCAILVCVPCRARDLRVAFENGAAVTTGECQQAMDARSNSGLSSCQACIAGKGFWSRGCKFCDRPSQIVGQKSCYSKSSSATCGGEGEQWIFGTGACKNDRVTAVVVGAGPAGLLSAWQLLHDAEFEAGRLKVHVIEMRRSFTRRNMVVATDTEPGPLQTCMQAAGEVKWPKEPEIPFKPIKQLQTRIKRTLTDTYPAGVEFHQLQAFGHCPPTKHGHFVAMVNTDGETLRVEEAATYDSILKEMCAETILDRAKTHDWNTGPFKASLEKEVVAARGRFLKKFLLLRYDMLFVTNGAGNTFDRAAGRVQVKARCKKDAGSTKTVDAGIGVVSFAASLKRKPVDAINTHPCDKPRNPSPPFPPTLIRAGMFRSRENYCYVNGDFLTPPTDYKTPAWKTKRRAAALAEQFKASFRDIEVEFVDTMGFAVFDSPMYFTKRSHLVEARNSPDENLRNTGLIFRLGDTAWGAQYESGTGIEAIAEGLHKLLPLMKKIANDGIPKLVSTNVAVLERARTKLYNYMMGEVRKRTLTSQVSLPLGEDPARARRLAQCTEAARKSCKETIEERASAAKVSNEFVDPKDVSTVGLQTSIPLSSEADVAEPQGSVPGQARFAHRGADAQMQSGHQKPLITWSDIWGI